jgi:predicted lysophospholipase L1 biosynthesis ABC-type transport system permease subunit
MAKWTLKALYLPTAIDTEDTPLTVRVHGDPNEARDALLDRLTTIDPAISGISTLRVMGRIEVYMLGLLFWIALVLGALALVLTVSGLFSVLSYIVEQRTKEIGVRMALGASAENVLRLMLAQLVRPVGVGLAVGAALAVVVGRVLLATPLASTVADIVRLNDPLAYAASLLCIVLTCALAAAIPARRAARIDPMTVLRQD